MNLSPHFTLAEMARSDTAVRLDIDNTPPLKTIAALRALCVVILEPVRAQFGRTVRVTSGYRAPAVNVAVGGNPKGSHPNGEAADFEVDGTDNLAVARWIATSGLPFDQLILEFHVSGQPASGWIHCSHRSAHNRGEVLTASRQVNGTVSYRTGLP